MSDPFTVSFARSFERSVRRLTRGERRLPSVSSIIALVLLVAWTSWLVLGRVSVYATSVRARIEVEPRVATVESPIEGAVMEVPVVLGQSVQRGDVLLALDARQVMWERTRAAAERDTIRGALERLEQQLAAERAALDAEQTAGMSAVQAAAAEQAEAERSAAHATEVARRTQQLYDTGTTSLLELLRLQSQADVLKETAKARRLDRDSLAHRAGADQRKSQARLLELERDTVELRGHIAAQDARIGQLDVELDLHRIRAPTDGTVADIAPVSPGTVVTRGEHIASLVPAGRLRAVAEFAPARSLGHLRTGQWAWIRLDAYPWPQYGMVSARVARVAGETRDGLIRVEIDIERENAQVPLVHGLTGSVEVELERITPLELILRAAGQRVGVVEDRRALGETSTAASSAER